MSKISHDPISNQASVFVRGISDRGKVSVRRDRVIETLDLGAGQLFVRYDDGNSCAGFYVDYEEAERVGLA
jgi:outer membrane receptor protein involved in Fe transport